MIEAAVTALTHTLIEESLIVAAVCFVFLLHVRSAMVAILTLAIGVLLAFAGRHALRIGSEVMRRIAGPLVCGMRPSTVLNLLVIAAIYAIVKGLRLAERSLVAFSLGKHAAPMAE